MAPACKCLLPTPTGIRDQRPLSTQSGHARTRPFSVSLVATALRPTFERSVDTEATASAKA
jgi:hypothetical protein